MVGSAQLGPNTTVLVEAKQVLRLLLAHRGRVGSILPRLATRDRQEVQPTTHHLGENPQIRLTIHLHRRALRPRRTIQTVPLRKLVAQPARLMYPWLQKERQLSVGQHARRVPVLHESLLSSTAQAMILRLKTTPLPRLLTLHRRTLDQRRPVSPLTHSHARSHVLRRHPIHPADNSRMVYPTRLQARAVQAAILVQTQQQMLAKRTNQQCMPTISLPLLPKSKKKCPLLSIRLGESTNTTKAPTRFLDGLSRPLFLRSNGAIRLLNAPG